MEVGNMFRKGIVALIVILFAGFTAFSLTFEVSMSQEAIDTVASLGLETPINGRVFVIVSKDSSSEPSMQTDVRGVPFWGKDYSK